MKRIDITWNNPKKDEDLEGTVSIWEGRDVTNLECVCVCEIKATLHSCGLRRGLKGDLGIISKEMTHHIHSLADAYHKGINSQPTIYYWEEV